MTPSGCRSRSLNAVKVRYLDRRRTAASCSVSFQIVISSTSFPLESGCKITHFFAFSNFYPHFFSIFFARKFIKCCVSGMFYGRFSGIREREPGGVLNIITRAQVRARLVRAKMSRKGENSCRMGRKIFWKDGILYRMTRKKIRKYSPRKGKNIRSDGKFIPENEDFSFEKPRKKCENDENGEKNFSVSPRKKLEKYPDCQERHA